MGQVKNNDLTLGISGRVGNRIVFRQLGNRTLVSTRPNQPKTPTEKQVVARARFQRAIQYAKAKMLDPAAKADYAAIAKTMELTSPFAAAVGDYLKAPVIKSINTEGYTGNVGDIILASVTGNLKVTAVKVTITTAAGDVLETGNAAVTTSNTEWKYIATKANATLPGTKVKVIATDKPGNETVLEKVI